MKIIIYQGQKPLFSGDPVDLRNFFSRKEKNPPDLAADRVEMYAMGDEQPTSTLSYKEFLTLFE